MLEKVIRLAVEMTVHDGSEEEFKEIVREMTAVSETEPGTLGYEWFFSADGRQCRLLETYADANGVLAHFQGRAVTELVPRIMQLCSLDRFEIYGDPRPELTKVATGFGARFFSYFTGLSR